MIELRKAIAQWCFGRFVRLWPWDDSERSAAMLGTALALSRHLVDDARSRA